MRRSTQDSIECVYFAAGFRHRAMLETERMKTSNISLALTVSLQYYQLNKTESSYLESVVPSSLFYRLMRLEGEGSDSEQIKEASVIGYTSVLVRWSFSIFVFVFVIEVQKLQAHQCFVQNS